MIFGRLTKNKNHETKHGEMWKLHEENMPRSKSENVLKRNRTRLLFEPGALGKMQHLTKRRGTM